MGGTELLLIKRCAILSKVFHSFPIIFH